jgi:hypothetical protein
MGCLGTLNNWAKRKGIDASKILCIFEDGDEGQGELIRFARSEGFNAIPQSKENIRAFDACDLAAWKLRALIDDALVKKLYSADSEAADKMMKSLGQLEDIARDSKEIGRFSMRALVKTCKALGIDTR